MRSTDPKSYKSYFMKRTECNILTRSWPKYLNAVIQLAFMLVFCQHLKNRSSCSPCVWLERISGFILQHVTYKIQGGFRHSSKVSKIGFFYFDPCCCRCSSYCCCWPLIAWYSPSLNPTLWVNFMYFSAHPATHLDSTSSKFLERKPCD